MLHDVVLVGIGNPYLGDDRVGIEVVKRVKELGCPWKSEVLYHIGFDLLDKILGFKKAIIVDACRYGNIPGSVFRWSKQEILSSQIHSVNTHGFNITNIIEIGELIYCDSMPMDVEVILIEAREIDTFSKECSPEVNKAIDEVVDYLKTLWEG